MNSVSFASPASTAAARSGENTRALKRSFGWILRAGLLLVVILGFWYLMLLNSLATRGFVLEELKNDRQQIQKELEKWDIALTIPTSLYALESSEQVQEMTVVEDPVFVEVRDGKLAMAESK